MALEAEFTVEPFAEGAPGPHVLAALDAARASGVAVDFGPFGTRLQGEDGAVLAAVGAVLQRAFHEGATRLSVQVHAAVTERR